MRGGLVSDYDFALPLDRIARYPADRRDESRLLVVSAHGPFEHARFRDLTTWLRPDDVLVVNDSKVIPARLLGEKETGASVEVLLIRPVEGDGRRWEALVRPGSKMKPGAVAWVSGEIRIEILDVLPGGARLVELSGPEDMGDALRRLGHMPLPPYIDRPDEALDRERYQTVYADREGSIAAPTAGLHFTSSLLNDITAAGVTLARVTLHVGLGTFRPVETDDPSEHEMHREWYDVPEPAAEAIRRARAAGGRVWAVGTTAVRTLESAATLDGGVRPGAGETRLFIRPPYSFRVVDGLITNFHLPRSTLLMLVAARAGYERTMAVYDEAIREGYRFYSYGDAMVVLPTRP
ncbi:MAG: tRNA preQ1(34) S-adenosylmethionine ribosyltransferase-isomerase QueA [Gemmatimonadota bacterium]